VLKTRALIASHFGLADKEFAPAFGAIQPHQQAALKATAHDSLLGMVLLKQRLAELLLV